MWKPIENYEGLYEISDEGQIRHVKYNRLVKPVTGTRGSQMVNLYKKNATKQFSVHRLVAKMFIPNPDNLTVVGHIDGDKTNNRVENLEWKPKKVRDSDRVIGTNLITGVETIYDSAVAAAEAVGSGRSNGVTMCANGKAKSAHGHTWRYADKPTVTHNHTRKARACRSVVGVAADGERFEFASVKDAARETGVRTSGIRMCIAGRLKTSGGLTWMYTS